MTDQVEKEIDRIQVSSTEEDGRARYEGLVCRWNTYDVDLMDLAVCRLAAAVDERVGPNDYLLCEIEDTIYEHLTS